MSHGSPIQWLRLPLTRRRLLQGAASLGALGALRPFATLAQDGNILRVRSYTDIDTLDPAYSTGIAEEEVHSCLYRKLTTYVPGSWDWQLDAAETLEQVDDTHIQFTLKPGIQWSNDYGELTAEDVKFSFERIIDPATESPNKPDWGSLDHVEVTGTHSGVIVLKEPFQPLWTIALPYIVGNIVCKKAVEDAGGRLGLDFPPVVSGPYILKEYQSKQRIVLARNPAYLGEPAAFEELHVLPIDDEKTAEIAFEAGDLDFTRVSVSSLEALKANPPEGSTVVEFPSLYYVWVGMNLDNEALQDENLRKAIQHAIDVPSILEAAYFGLAEPSTGIIAPGLTGHREQSLVPPQADFAKAQEYMDAAGLGSVDLTLDVLNKTTNVSAAQIIQATLAQVGINVEINLHESGAFWSLGDESQGERYKDVQLILNRYSMSADPYYATSWFTTEQVGIWNWERFSNEEFDRLHQEAKSESDPDKRAQMYQHMQNIMEESGAYRFITHEVNPVIYRNTVEPAFRPDGLPILRAFKPA